MLRLFRSRSHRSTPKAAAARPRRPRRARLDLEALEGRQLLSLSSEFQVNTTTRNGQFHADNASAANGLSVVVWVDTYNTSNNDHDIRARMYKADGSPLTDEIIVDFDVDLARTPAVAMDADGDFVITWVKDSPVSPGHGNVVAQRFYSTGAAKGGIIQVANSSKSEYAPDVAMDANGNFVVSYTLANQGSNGQEDVWANRYGSSGNFLGFVQVATAESINERKSSVAMSPDGRFAVAYDTRVGFGLGENVRLNRFDAAGNTLGDLSISSGESPSVAMDNSGNAVVAYDRLIDGDWDIKAKRVFYNGAVGGEINIRNTRNDEINPTVALSRTGGSFVVAYETALLGVPGNWTVEVAEFTAADTLVGWQNLPGFPNNGNPALSIDADGDYLLSYTGGIGGGEPNIFARRGHLF